MFLRELTQIGANGDECRGIAFMVGRAYPRAVVLKGRPKIAQHFNAGSRAIMLQVPQGRQNPWSSLSQGKSRLVKPSQAVWRKKYFLQAAQVGRRSCAAALGTDARERVPATSPASAPAFCQALPANSNQCQPLWEKIFLGGGHPGVSVATLCIQPPKSPQYSLNVTFIFAIQFTPIHTYVRLFATPPPPFKFFGEWAGRYAAGPFKAFQGVSRRFKAFQGFCRKKRIVYFFASCTRGPMFQSRSWASFAVTVASGAATSVSLRLCGKIRENQGNQTEIRPLQTEKFYAYQTPRLIPFSFCLFTF